MPKTWEKPGIDWEKIEAGYRAGVLSLRQMADAAGLTEGAIRRRAKRDKWDRDLEAKVQAKADALVRKREVRVQLRDANAMTERVLIEASAEVVANVKSSHRNNSGRLMNLGLALLTELEGQCAEPELLSQLGEIMNAGQPTKMAQIYDKIISTPSRVDSAKKVAETLKHAIYLERESYNISATPDAQVQRAMVKASQLDESI